MLKAAGFTTCCGNSTSKKAWAVGIACLRALSRDCKSYAFHCESNAACNDEGIESAASAAGPTLLARRGPYACRLASRAVIRFDGPDTVSFLQGLVTNDMARFTKQPPPPTGAPVPTVNEPVIAHGPMYAGLLNPQGRFLYDLFFYRPSQPSERLDRSGSGPAFNGHETPALVADVDADAVDELLSTLKRHRLRARVHFESSSEELAAWVRFAGVLAMDPGAAQEEEAGGIGYGATNDQFGKSASEASSGGWLWHKDPRLSALGLRGIFPAETTPPLVEAQEQVGEEYYKLWRYEHGVPEGSTEIPKGEALPLEYNLDGLSAISFEKGCYIGQELTARTYHRGVIRKRLMPVQFMSPQEGGELQRAAVTGAEVIDTASRKRVGKVTAALGPRGLAHLRLEAALRESSHLQIADNDGAIVKPQRPEWWPSEWGQEALVDNSPVPASK